MCGLKNAVVSIGCGVGISRLTYSLSLNLYFQKRRRKVAGVSLALRSLGTMLAPQLIILLLGTYGIRNTVLLLGGMCLHTLCTALLLEPVELHMKEVKKDNDKITSNNTYEKLVLIRRVSQIVLEEKRRHSVAKRDSIRRESSITLDGEQRHSIGQRESIRSEDKILLGADQKHRRGSVLRRVSKIALDIEGDGSIPFIKRGVSSAIEETEMNILIEEYNKTIQRNIFRKIVDTLELSLLGNSLFLTISIGMLLSVFADASFSSLSALILSELGFEDYQIAIFSSISYISNIILRIIIPFIGDYFKRSSRFMYVLSCIMIILGRFAVIYLCKMGGIILIAIIWGATKAGRGIYSTVVIADNFPAHQLAAAESINMVLLGIVFFTCGTLLGIVKDLLGSYVKCVYVLNALTGVTCLLWTAEMLYYKITKNKKNKLNK